MVESKNNKLFVGNVPFQCTREEFVKCFKDLPGFIDADIIRRYKSKLSRGFGFVIFEKEEQVEKLLNTTDITIHDRVLRFSPYSTEEKFRYHATGSQYKVFVRNLDPGMTAESLENALSKYGEVVSCVVTSKNGRVSGIVSFRDYDGYKNAIENQKDTDNDNCELDISIYKKRVNKFRKLNDPRAAYREGFRAGHIVGFKQGLQQGIMDRSADHSDVDVQQDYRVDTINNDKNTYAALASNLVYE